MHVPRWLFLVDFFAAGFGPLWAIMATYENYRACFYNADDDATACEWDETPWVQWRWYFPAVFLMCFTWGLTYAICSPVGPLCILRRSMWDEILAPQLTSSSIVLEVSPDRVVLLRLLHQIELHAAGLTSSWTAVPLAFLTVCFGALAMLIVFADGYGAVWSIFSVAVLLASHEGSDSWFGDHASFFHQKYFRFAVGFCVLVGFVKLADTIQWLLVVTSKSHKPKPLASQTTRRELLDDRAPLLPGVADFELDPGDFMPLARSSGVSKSSMPFALPYVLDRICAALFLLFVFAAKHGPYLAQFTLIDVVARLYLGQDTSLFDLRWYRALAVLVCVVSGAIRMLLMRFHVFGDAKTASLTPLQFIYAECPPPAPLFYHQLELEYHLTHDLDQVEGYSTTPQLVTPLYRRE